MNIRSGGGGGTVLMSGGSRGIGLAIGIAAARLGANVALLAKADVPDPRLPGTVYSAARPLSRKGASRCRGLTDNTQPVNSPACGGANEAFE
jgi:NAD(P)-dependent dehydrogenase (short-subunit alcohol dehydrogenase family)